MFPSILIQLENGPKHNAPNRFLYIKVAKLRAGVGSAEMSHLQNGSVKIFKEYCRYFTKKKIFKNK